MEKLIMFRNTVFWWLGCWLVMNTATQVANNVKAWWKQRRMREPVKLLPQMTHLTPPLRKQADVEENATAERPAENHEEDQSMKLDSGQEETSHEAEN